MDDGGGGSGGGAAPALPSFATLVVFEAVLVPLALALGWAVGERPLADFEWTAGAARVGLLAALPVLALLAVAARWPVGPLRPVRAFLEGELAPTLAGCRWPDLALLAVVSGVGEEMLFRGVLLTGLARAFGPAVGLGLTGLLYGLLHPVSLGYVVLTGLLGVYLGLVRLAVGNLLAVIVAHSACTFVALAVLNRGDGRPPGGADD